jgi:hypothetical protein
MASKANKNRKEWYYYYKWLKSAKETSIQANYLGVKKKDFGI